MADFPAVSAGAAIPRQGWSDRPDLMVFRFIAQGTAGDGFVNSSGLARRCNSPARAQLTDCLSLQRDGIL